MKTEVTKRLSSVSRFDDLISHVIWPTIALLQLIATLHLYTSRTTKYYNPESCQNRITIKNTARL